MSTQERNPNEQCLLLHRESLPLSTEGKGDKEVSLEACAQHSMSLHHRAISVGPGGMRALWHPGSETWCFLHAARSEVGTRGVAALSQRAPAIPWVFGFVLIIIVFGWLLAISVASHGHHWTLSQVPVLVAVVNKSPTLIFLKMRSPSVYLWPLWPLNLFISHRFL